VIGLSVKLARGCRRVDGGSITRELINPFMDILAGLGKGWRREATLTLAHCNTLGVKNLIKP